MENIDDDLALDEENTRVAQPIRRQFEQENIVLSYLLSPDPKDHVLIDLIQKDPELQKEVCEMIDLCRLKVERMNRRNGPFMPYVAPPTEDLSPVCAD